MILRGLHSVHRMIPWFLKFSLHPHPLLVSVKIKLGRKKIVSCVFLSSLMIMFASFVRLANTFKIY